MPIKPLQPKIVEIMIKKIKALIATVELTENKVGLETLNEILEEAKHSEKVNHKYGVFFDKVISDGVSPEEAARDLKLL